MFILYDRLNGFTKPIFYDMFNGVDQPLGTLPAIS